MSVPFTVTSLPSVADLEHDVAITAIRKQSGQPYALRELRRAQRLAAKLLDDAETTDLWVPLAAVAALRPGTFVHDSAIRVLRQLRSVLIPAAMTTDVEAIDDALHGFVRAISSGRAPGAGGRDD